MNMRDDNFRTDKSKITDILVLKLFEGRYYICANQDNTHTYIPVNINGHISEANNFSSLPTTIENVKHYLKDGVNVKYSPGVEEEIAIYNTMIEFITSPQPYKVPTPVAAVMSTP
jgi:hypothetical protein